MRNNLNVMNPLLARIQNASLQMEWWPLAIAGALAVVLGLFLWLGGARHASFVVGVLGAVLGAAVGLFASSWFNIRLPVAILGGAILFTVGAVIFQNMILLLLAAVIFALVVGTTYLGSTFVPGESEELSAEQRAYGYLDEWSQGTSPQDLQDGSDGSARDRFEVILQDVRAKASQNKGWLVMWLVIGAVGGLILGMLLKKVLTAVCCSIVGTAGVLGGMMSLFFAKKVAVFSALQDRPRQLAVLAVGMVVFGCLIQVMLAAAHRSRQKRLVVEKKES